MVPIIRVEKVLRVNVLGVKGKYLDHKEYEIPWAIIFEGTVGKFGVDTISFTLLCQKEMEIYVLERVLEIVNSLHLSL